MFVSVGRAGLVEVKSFHFDLEDFFKFIFQMQMKTLLSTLF